MKEEWQHQKGDMYYVLQSQFGKGLQIVHTLISKGYDSWSYAWGTGMGLLGHDDFNLLVSRDGKWMATLWLNEIVDDGEDVLSEIQEEIGDPQ